MPKFIQHPTVVEAHGNIPKRIEEYIGAVNTGNTNISIARMKSPGGWEEPGQTPEFDEFTLVLKGVLQVETKEKTFQIAEGQAIIIHAGEWVRYSSPSESGAEYVAVCLPAFSPQTVHRDL